MVRPTTPSTWVSAIDVISEFELLVHLDALLDVGEARELGHELRGIHRLGRVLVLHLGDEQPQERVVVDRMPRWRRTTRSASPQAAAFGLTVEISIGATSALLAVLGPPRQRASHSEPVANGDGHLDDALEVVRLLEPDLLGLAHDPEPDGDQIGAQLVRQVVVGLGRGPRSARSRACARTAGPPPPPWMRTPAFSAACRSSIERSMAWRSRCACALRGLVEHLGVGKLVHALPFRTFPGAG